jgi:nitrite reductase/ring-hydroxylating ferredoxin subunit
MPEATGPAAPPAEGLPLCASSALAERDKALVFDVQLWGARTSAFALRIDGQVVAYLNRCAHVPTEMDWQPGEFLDAERQFIICSIHGATYEPKDGRCVGGPCGRGRLMPVAVSEHGGQVYWYPGADIRAPDPSPGPSP